MGIRVWRIKNKRKKKKKRMVRMDARKERKKNKKITIKCFYNIFTINFK